MLGFLSLLVRMAEDNVKKTFLKITHNVCFFVFVSFASDFCAKLHDQTLHLTYVVKDSPKPSDSVILYRVVSTLALYFGSGRSWGVC